MKKPVVICINVVPVCIKGVFEFIMPHKGTAANPCSLQALCCPPCHL